jgi:hypothetical protein
MSDSYTQCPYCHTSIPDGALVCRGCGAEKHVTQVTVEYDIFERIKHVAIAMAIVGVLATTFYNLPAMGLLGILAFFITEDTREETTWVRGSVYGGNQLNRD